jgi:hypothetical protein
LIEPTYFGYFLVLDWRILGLATGITGKETRPMRTLIDASLTTIFTTMSCGGVKQVFLGSAPAYISKRKGRKFVKLSALILQGLASV